MFQNVRWKMVETLLMFGLFDSNKPHPWLSFGKFNKQMNDLLEILKKFTNFNNFIFLIIFLSILLLFLVINTWTSTLVGTFGHYWLTIHTVKLPFIISYISQYNIINELKVLNIM